MEKSKPKIVFFGTPEFSVKILEALGAAGLTPVLIITAPDKPRGRKMRFSPSPVKKWAQEKNIPVEHNYDSLKLASADLFVVASFGKILPKKILDIPKHGTLNVHPSLLPKLRGASPIQSAILRGEKETGVTIMLIGEGVDNGPILSQQKLEFPISNFQFLELEDKLAELGGKLLVETIPKWLNGKIKPQAQDPSKATYTKLITKKDGEIDWNEKPEIIDRKIRAFTPWPGAYTILNDRRIIVTKARLDKQGELKIERIKPEGKREMDYNGQISFTG